MLLEAVAYVTLLCATPVTPQCTSNVFLPDEIPTMEEIDLLENGEMRAIHSGLGIPRIKLFRNLNREF